MAPVPVRGLWVVTVPVRRLVFGFKIVLVVGPRKQKPLFTLFIVYFIWITYILRDVSRFQTLYKV
jgi:hypothetical protein